MADVWLNGEFVNEDDARIDPRDGGFLHGAGVFTTMRAGGGRIFRVEHHLRRLRASSQQLYVPLPFRDDELASAATELLKRNGLKAARLALTVSRGRSTSEAGNEVHRPTVLLTAGELTRYPAEFYEKGMTVLLNSEQKANPYDVQAGHKTLDYFSRFAALREAARRGAGEALWFNVHNYLQGGCVCNVFLVEGDALVTPPTNEELADPAMRPACPYPRSNVLPGVMRGWVMEQQQATRAAVDVHRLLAASEVFVTNSIMGVMPVTRLEQRVVGDGTPGPVTRRLMGALASA